LEKWWLAVWQRAIAERDGNIWPEVNDRIEELWRRQRHLERIDLEEQHYNPTEFSKELFKIVATHNIIKGFVPPVLSLKDEEVPTLNSLGNKKIKKRRWSWSENEYDLKSLNGSFGKIITEWPMPNKSSK
jgi:hypothetical protein